MHAPTTNSKPLVPLNRSLVVTAVLAGLIVAAALWLVARNQSDAAWVLRSLSVRNEVTNVLNQIEMRRLGSAAICLPVATAIYPRITGRQRYFQLRLIVSPIWFEIVRKSSRP